MSSVQTPISRCTVPRGKPYELHWLITLDPNGREVHVVKDEWTKAIRDAPHGEIGRDELLLRVAAVRAIMSRAQEGRATMRHEVGPGHDLEHVSLDPKLWELRAEVGDWLFRQYHGEPQQFPYLLVAVKAHAKRVFADNQKTQDDQNSHIQEASFRYETEASRDWGWDGAS